MNTLKNKIEALVITFMMLLFSFAIYAQETYRDDFNTVSYGNNNGTSGFTGNWVETNETTNPNSGRIRINSNQLRFRNLDDRSISRSLNIFGAKSAILTFDYDATARAGERLLAQLWNATTSSWETVATINTNTTGSISYTLTTDQISATSSIQFISNSGGWSNGDTIFIDNVQFQVTPDLPPTVTATGNQDFCQAIVGSTINIATSVSITDPDDTTTEAVYIQISSGYVNGEDLLTLTGTHPNITASWDAVQGEITLNGPTTYAEFETAILAVVYSNSSTSAIGTRQFSITVGTANYLPTTGHYYEYVPSLGITWTAANAAANSRTYFGLQGYLATLTSQVEADFSGLQAIGVGWIGANDVATEGDWQWVTGPEAGISFWSGGIGGTVVPPFNFAFWNGGEPNNCCSGEDYAHITHPNTNPNGSWNDLSNTGSTNPASNYHPQGYVVEYGGMPGDPILNITGTTTITLVCTADLNLTKTVDNASPDQGDNITFTLTISNDGLSAPTSIVVRDVIPTDLSYTHPNFSTTQGTATFNAGTREFEWNLGTFVLGVGNTISLTYTVTVDVCGEFTNQAEIINSSLADPDSTPNNGG